MYNYLINKIATILGEITQVKEVFTYPLAGTPTKSPAVIVIPDTFENRFEDTSNNFKIYRFKMWVWISLAGTTEKAVFSGVLPKALDAIIEKFDEAWNGGTVDGHRIWQIIDNGGWQLVVTEDSKTAIGELNLTVKMATG